MSRSAIAFVAVAALGLASGAGTWQLMRPEPPRRVLVRGLTPAAALSLAAGAAARVGDRESRPPPEPPPLPVAEEVIANAKGPPNGRLSLRCEPDCDEVYLRGERLGASPVTEYPVPPGDYPVLLRWGKTVKQIQIAIAPEKTTSYDVTYRYGVVTSRSSNTKGTLAAKCLPDCDQIKLDDDTYGAEIVKVTLRPGSYRLVLQQGAEKRVRVVQVRPGEMSRVREDFELPPDCDPRWEKLKDGRMRIKKHCLVPRRFGAKPKR